MTQHSRRSRFQPRRTQRPVSGVVVEVNVQPGQRVKKDEVLRRLDTKVREANVDSAKAHLAKHTRSAS